MNSMMTILSLSLVSLSAFAGAAPQNCSEMDSAAAAIAKINGATFATPSFRIAEIPVETAKGQEYAYQFDARYSAGDELPTKTVGTIKVTALRKTGETACKVLTVEYVE